MKLSEAGVALKARVFETLEDLSPGKYDYEMARL